MWFLFYHYTPFLNHYSPPISLISLTPLHTGTHTHTTTHTHRHRHTHIHIQVCHTVFQTTHTALKPHHSLSLHGTGLVIKLRREPTSSHSSHPLFPLMSKVSRGSRVRGSMGAPTHTQAHTKRNKCIMSAHKHLQQEEMQRVKTKVPSSFK